MDQPLTSGEKSNTAVEHLAHRLKVDFVRMHVGATDRHVQFLFYAVDNNFK